MNCDRGRFACGKIAATLRKRDGAGKWGYPVKAEKAVSTYPTYRRLRTEPLWRLLGADNGPAVIALLQSRLGDETAGLPGSLLYERLDQDLEELRGHGVDLPQTAQAYVSSWLQEKYLVRSFPAGSVEEVYGLSTATAEAIRFVSGMAQPHAMATESRLALVIQALVRLAEETDKDASRRLGALTLERERIDRQIAAIRTCDYEVLPDAPALEQAREIVALAGGLASDFRRVRDQFDELNRSLREQLLDNEGRRGDVLHSVFAGIDVIAESEAGRTFAAFWRLLIDPEQNAALDAALEGLLSREFVTRLDPQSRRFLGGMTTSLLEQGGLVHEVLQHFARSLKHFVQSREYREQRHLRQLLRQAQRAAVALKDEVKMTETLRYELALTSCDIRSYSQWDLYDPALQAVAEPMREGEAPAIDLELVGSLVAQSEIDFSLLRANVRAVLERRTRASIAEILQEFPATQGLGSIVGLIALGSRHGDPWTNLSETVSWLGGDDERRSARIPAIYFVQERAHELA